MTKLCFGASLAALMMASALGAAYGADYTPVKDARLQNPEPENWLMTRGNYAGWSYSPLAQINPANVTNLQLKWSWAMNEGGAVEVTPIVHDGVIFLSNTSNTVQALNAKTG